MRKMIAGAALAFAAGAAAGLGISAGLATQPAPLPAGFTVRHADGVTYVCSQRPVYCTGNAPAWAQAGRP